MSQNLSDTHSYFECSFLTWRFYKPAEIITAEREVVPVLSDDIQLSVEEYRSKLYEVSFTYMIDIGDI